MKEYYILMSVFLLVSSVFGQENIKISDPRFSKVRELIMAQVREGKVASISVAAAEDGEIIWEESFG